MSRSATVEPVAGKIATVARALDSSPTTVRRLVKAGVLPAPIRLTPRGAPMWLMVDVYAALEARAGRQLAA